MDFFIKNRREKEVMMMKRWMLFMIAAVFAAMPALALAQGGVELPKTGQKQCYDAAGNVIDCPTVGQTQDGAVLAGVAWPDPRFTDNGDGTVTDNLTGLIWLKDANCINTNYPDFDNDGTAGDGRVTWQHALDFIAGINDGTYPDCQAGYTDWRLPNIVELESLVHAGYNEEDCGGTPCTRLSYWLENQGFQNVQSDYYWSGTSHAGNTGHAWFVDMWDGYVGVGLKSDYCYVWPVRAGQ
jgi:hypothetical protein